VPGQLLPPRRKAIIRRDDTFQPQIVQVCLRENEYGCQGAATIAGTQDLKKFLDDGTTPPVRDWPVFADRPAEQAQLAPRGVRPEARLTP
jgi:hypothetical protein